MGQLEEAAKAELIIHGKIVVQHLEVPRETVHPEAEVPGSRVHHFRQVLASVVHGSHELLLDRQELGTVISHEAAASGPNRVHHG